MKRAVLNDFDSALKAQHWNTTPQKELRFPTSTIAALNASMAIAISAYPQRQQLKRNGKAHRYQQALAAYILRASHREKHLKELPSWVHELRTDKMWNRLESGNRCLLRSFLIRDLISAAMIEKSQSERAKLGQPSTFSISFSPDLHKGIISIPIKQVNETHVMLIGGPTEDKYASLRSAIKAHRAALSEFEGPSPRIDGSDEESFYQNTLTRYVKPVLRSSHILQVVWEAFIRHRAEAIERRLPIDQILMRKPDWASNLSERTANYAGTMIFFMRDLGIPSCSCSLLHLDQPSPDS